MSDAASEQPVVYTCPYVPTEWIVAHGLAPLRLEVPDQRSFRSGACPFAEGLVQTVTQSISPRAIILTTACDQMRRAYDLVKTTARCPSFLLQVPRTWQVASSRQFFYQEIERLGRFLVSLGGQALVVFRHLWCDIWHAELPRLAATTGLPLLAVETLPRYGRPLGQHLAQGDRRLTSLSYDNSWAALRLWNFLLSEEERLQAARARGDKIIGTMKDLGTVPVMAYALEDLCQQNLDETRLEEGIRRANQVRHNLAQLRHLVYRDEQGRLPALEMLIAEMLALHFCSDLEECQSMLEMLLATVKVRQQAGQALEGGAGARLFWVNPVADLCVMNLLEDCGARICGTEYLFFSHALDLIPTDVPPLEALARMALADPMVGSAFDRATRICHDVQQFGAEVVVISRIPGASHCAWEGEIISDTVRDRMGLPVLEIEVSPVSDAAHLALRTRLEALIEAVLSRRSI